MTLLEFAAKSEWPAVVAIGLLIFRRPISQMVARLHVSSLDLWGAKAEFSEGLSVAEAALQTGSKSPGGLLPQGSGDPHNDQSCDGDAPTLAAVIVSASWAKLDMALANALDERTTRTPPKPSWRRPREAFGIARELGFDDGALQALLQLRKLHFGTASGVQGAITHVQALQYQRIANELIDRVKKLQDDV